MTLPTRNLDDRTFQDIVDEAKKRIAASCPAWTDHNVSDPGVTLVELFAWMTETILYRLNQVPEKNYIKLMELVGLQLGEPKPAETEVTFYLSSPVTLATSISKGTEVATVRTETQPAIVFSTDDDLVIRPPRLIALLTGQVTASPAHPESLVQQDHRKLELGFNPALEVFGSSPRVGNALYFGFENDLSKHVLDLEITCEAKAPKGMVPDDPPWTWEVYAGGAEDNGWPPAVIQSDTTKGMDRSGSIRLRLPRMKPRHMSACQGYWLRCRAASKPNAEQPTLKNEYSKSPLVTKVVISSWGGTVTAKHASIVRGELLGTSDGSPGQVFHLEKTPLLSRGEGETLEVRLPGEAAWQRWKEVRDFADSKSNDAHFTCDSTTGEVRTGPALRQPDGSVRAFGALLPRGAQVRFSAYRYGGGVAGNVQAGRLKVPKTSIPYVAEVINHVDAAGGYDAETIEMAQLRAPQLIRKCGQAVTAGDFETLARQANSRVQRALCLQPAPEDGRPAGQITLLLVPGVDYPERRIPSARLRIDDDLRQSVLSFMADYRLLTVLLDIREPEYVRIEAAVSAIATPEADRERVRAEIERRLYRFINPIVGGPRGDGWPFGRALYVSDVYGCLQNVPGIEFIESLKLYQMTAAGARPEVKDRLNIPATGLIRSGEHHVEVK